jgi:hypothetical protein
MCALQVGKLLHRACSSVRAGMAPDEFMLVTALKRRGFVRSIGQPTEQQGSAGVSVSYLPGTLLNSYPTFVVFPAESSPHPVLWTHLERKVMCQVCVGWNTQQLTSALGLGSCFMSRHFRTAAYCALDSHHSWAKYGKGPEPPARLAVATTKAHSLLLEALLFCDVDCTVDCIRDCLALSCMQVMKNTGQEYPKLLSLNDCLDIAVDRSALFFRKVEVRQTQAEDVMLLLSSLEAMWAGQRQGSAATQATSKVSAGSSSRLRGKRKQVAVSALKTAVSSWCACGFALCVLGHELRSLGFLVSLCHGVGGEHACHVKHSAESCCLLTC